MPDFSNTSKEKLSQCHPDLQKVFYEVIKYFDCSIITGFRGEKEQNACYQNGTSTKKWPDSKHNIEQNTPAVDVVPYPINWNDVDRMRFFVGYVLGTARQMFENDEIKHLLKSGIDWDNDTMTNDQRFFDAPHFELIQK